jgi:hypothetical protein
LLYTELNSADLIDWSGAIIDGTVYNAPEGSEDTDPNPLRIAANPAVNIMCLTDVVPMMEVLTAMEPVDCKPGPPREKPDRL